MLILNKKVFNKDVRNHTRMIKSLGEYLKVRGNVSSKDENDAIFCPVINSGRELALAYSLIKCEKTGDWENLQFHHLIGRKNKGIMPFYKYAMRRNFWLNLCILAQKNHPNNTCPDKTISRDLIAKVKKRYFIQDDS